MWNSPQHKPHACFMYCNDEMLRIIGRTIEHVIGRSSKELEGIETEAKVVGSAEAEEKGSADGDQNVYLLDIIDASGFLHKGSAVSSKFALVSGDTYAAAAFFYIRVYFAIVISVPVDYLSLSPHSIIAKRSLTRVTGTISRFPLQPTSAKALRPASPKCPPAKSLQP
jgi:hypothetical protein